jgi:bifunctional DNA-binding transcriptional regulator/antitoxin component of YhaV-PrlF toxin-antitoxin module
MENTKQGVLSIARLGANGRLTIPVEYRRALDLSGDAPLMLIQVGDALVITPCDEAFSAVSQRLEARMHQAGSNVSDLTAAAAAARAEIAREEFGADQEE